MAKKKKRLSKAARRRRARRRRRIITCVWIAVLILIIAAAVIFILKPFGTKDPQRTAVTSGIEAEATEMIPTVTEPIEIEPTETPEPTVAPTPTPEPVPTETPYAGPTPDPTRAPAYITITATGDVAIGSGGIKNSNDFPVYFKQYGPEYFFENVRDYFMEDDLTIVNLEGPLTSAKSKRPGRTFNFRGDPEYVNILTYGSVELCNIANNHLMDYKDAGANETIELLRQNGIGVSGGMDNNEIEYYTDIRGYTVGSIGFTEWNFKEDFIIKTVMEARAKCDLLIVSIHWNEEGAKQLSPYCKKISQKMIDAGADIIIGNHTHSLGEIAKYNGKYVINSLGNFCFGGNDRLWNYETDVFRQRFLLTDNGNGSATVSDAGIDLKPALNYTTGERRKNNFKPGWPDEALGLEILQTVGGYSKTLDMSTVTWLPQSYVAQHDLMGQLGGTVMADMSAEEAAEKMMSNASAIPEA